MQISEVGLNLIKRFEGFKLSVYKDAVGLLTIGYGHLLKPGENYTVIDELTAMQLLRKDVEGAEDTVNKAATVSLTQNQFDALICLVFNIGGGNFIKSTLLRVLNQGNFNQAADEFLRWNRAGGRILKGLALRREMERELFLA